MSRVYDQDGWESAEFKKLDMSRDTIESAHSSNNGFRPNLENIVGICYNCHNYCYAFNEVHQLVYSYCQRFEIKRAKERIVECSNYAERNRLSLESMYEIATLIDVIEDKAKIGGFTRNTNKFKVSIKPPTKEED